MARARRGRISKIDLLPEEAKPYVTAALNALKDRDRTQEDIREELNTHLLSLGLNPVSRSAFNRKSMWLATVGQNMQQMREIASILAEKLDEAPEGDVGLLLNETIKTLVFDVLQDASLSDEAPSMVMLRQAADAILRLEKARMMSFENAEKLRKAFAKQGEEAIKKAGKHAGLNAETIAKLRREFLGVVEK